METRDINMKYNIIYNDDCVKILDKRVDTESINLVYADPPYNLSGKKLNLINNKTGGAFYKMNEKWDTFTNEKYELFTLTWMKSIYDVLVSNGSLYVSCTFHNLGTILNCAKQLNLNLKNIITWYKTNAMPNITKRTFTHSTEYICWFVKGNNWIFNYNEVKKINWIKTKNGKSRAMRDLIELPIVQGKERLKNGKNRALHPTQKPEKLLKIIITASSNKRDIVLDPFCGTGTTCCVAKKLERNYIGIELDEKFYKASLKRIDNKCAK